MPKLTFKYGAMGSTKTRELLAIDYNFRVDNSLKSYIVKPSIDNRYGVVDKVTSRDGGERLADLVASKYTNIFENVKSEMPSIVLVDEAQFLTKNQVLELAKVVDELDIPVIAFGLKNDSFNDMFEGTKYLMLYSDRCEQIETVCRECKTRKATMNMRLFNNRPIFMGTQIMTGGNESYKPVCRKCYNEIKIKTEKGVYL